MNIEIKRSEPAAAVPRDTAAASDPLGPADDTRVADLERELSEMRDRWMRSEADIANIRVRARRDVEAAENLHRGVQSLPPRSAHETRLMTSLRDGFSGIERSFVALLERNGISRHDPTGEVFDSGLHQAMDEQATDRHPPGTVLQAWSSAWTLNGRLLRPAMVVVAAAPHGHAGQTGARQP
jgi:molecular chaperone GrpE